ncbi:hypothetical protein ABK040_007846 [Willaertia magna]
MNPHSSQFIELVEAETLVDIERLRDLSRHGIPEELRGIVWKYLLNVYLPDKAEQMKREHQYFQNLKQLQYLKQITIDNEEENNNDISSIIKKCKIHCNIKLYNIEELLYLFKPFEFVYIESKNNSYKQDPEKNLHDASRCFESLLLKKYFHESLSIQVAKLITLFKCTQPDLYLYFESEELEPNEWALPWVKYLLSKQLPMDCVLRLWDTYFATNDFDLHIYVCLSVLQYYSEMLMELEYSEIKYFLNNIYILKPSI